MTRADNTGCCDGPEWRGHLCPYHAGYQDALDHIDDTRQETHMTPPPIGGQSIHSPAGGGVKRWPATAPNVAGDPIDETGGLGVLVDPDTLPVHVTIPTDTSSLIVTETLDTRELALSIDTAARLCQDLADALGWQIT